MKPPRKRRISTAAARVVVRPEGAIGACLAPMEIVRSGRPSFIGPLPGRCGLLYGGLPRTDEPPPRPTSWGGAWQTGRGELDVQLGQEHLYFP